MRKEMNGGGALQKSSSCSSLDRSTMGASSQQGFNNYLTVHGVGKLG